MIGRLVKIQWIFRDGGRSRVAKKDNMKKRKNQGRSLVANAFEALV